MKDRLLAYVTTNKMDCRIYKTTLFDNPIFAVYLDGEKEYCDSYIDSWLKIISYITNLINDETSNFHFIKKDNIYYSEFKKAMGEEAIAFFKELDNQIFEKVYDKAVELGIE